MLISKLWNLKHNGNKVYNAIIDQDRLDVFLMEDMLSWEEAASEISNEFWTEEKILSKKPTSLGSQVYYIK